MADKPLPEVLAAQVISSSKYQHLSPDLVVRLSQEALAAGFKGKAALKHVRNKLHQVGAAYLKRDVDYSAAKQTLSELPQVLSNPEVKGFCLNLMRAHASTAERLPILETFFQTCLAPIAPITTVMDLGCGLNPLAIPWMPLAENACYQAYDIYLDMLDLINAFFAHCNLSGQATSCDLIARIPDDQAQVAFLLKTIPCLEQMDKTILNRLLDGIQTDHILVSFPVHSLSGRGKGMPAFYRDHFQRQLVDKNWQVQEFLFATELAFLVSK